MAVEDRPAAEPLATPDPARSLDTALYNSRITNKYLKMLRQRYPQVDLGALLRSAGMELHQVEDQGHWFTQWQINCFQEKLRELTGNPGIAREEPFQCESRQGYLESIAQYFSSRLTRIEHPECIFRGDPRCRYLVTWQPTPAARWRRARVPAVLAAVAAVAAATAGRLEWAHLAMVLPLLAAAVLLFSIAALHFDNRGLRAAVSQLEHTADELVDQTDLNSRNSLMINEIGQSLIQARSIQEILGGVVEILERRLDYDRGVVLLADPEASRFEAVAGFGYPPEEIATLQGEDAFRLDHVSSRGIFPRCFHERRPILVNDLTAAAGDYSPQSIEIARRLGVKSFICCPIVFEGRSLGVLAVANCSTRRHLLERDVNLLMGIAPLIAISVRNVRLVDGNIEQARCLNDELERRVAARTAALEAANKELESFSYSVSHDLRAPLRAIEGFSAIVSEDYGERLDDEGRRLLDVVRANAKRMSRLIDDLLAFSRTGRSEMRRGRVAMGELARSVFAEIVGDEAARAKIAFTIGDLPEAAGDAALLRQVWVNLLANAVKFSAKKERPAIEVSGAREDDQVVYRVRDNGEGFDMQYAGKLFGVFQRLHSPEQFEGTGIGLALVQRIVARHGGSVRAEGEVGQGATFSFSLPRGGPDGGSGCG